MALFLLGTFYLTMVGAGYLTELIFGPRGLVPSRRNAQVIEPHIALNYDTVLNIIFLVLAGVLAGSSGQCNEGIVVAAVGVGPAQ